MKTLGILGGLGPESTGTFYLELIHRFQETYRPQSNADYPHILINSISAPDLIDGPITEDILGYYKKGLKELEEWGAEMIVIACNSAYCFIDELQHAVRVPIINAPLEVEKELKRTAVKKIFILASPTTLRRRLYDYPWVQSFSLSENETTAIGNTIKNYNVGDSKKEEQEALYRLAQKAHAEGYLVIAGCTEVNAMLKNTDIPFLDPMRVMIDEIIRIWMSSYVLEKSLSRIHGLGIVTRTHIPAKTYFYSAFIDAASNAPMTRWAHIDDRWFSDEKILNWINHSCEPNAEIVIHDSLPVLKSLRDIAAGEEIVCDYGLSEIGGKGISCTCGSKACKGTFPRIEQRL